MYITSGMISAAEKKEGSDNKIIDFLHCKQVMAVGAMQMYISFGKKTLISNFGETLSQLL